MAKVKKVEKKDKKYFQIFSREVPKYQYNADNDNLEVVGVIDLQQEIDSYKDTSLEYILDRFLTPEMELKLQEDYFNNINEEEINIDNRDFFDRETERQELIEELENNGITPTNIKEVEKYLYEKFKKKEEVIENEEKKD